MMKVLYPFLFAFVKSILQSVAQSVWEGLWLTIFEGIEIAEEKWEEEGQGEVKKEFVQDKVMDFINDKASLNFFERKAIELFLSKTLDGLLTEINNKMGKDWIKQVEKYKKELADMISFID